LVSFEAPKSIVYFAVKTNVPFGTGAVASLQNGNFETNGWLRELQHEVHAFLMALSNFFFAEGLGGTGFRQ
jgi:hypothetical protein